MPAHATTSSEFENLYSVLNAQQRKAVDTIEGPVMVIAGPGTGKTTILTLRIANILLKTDTSPDSILALTFTESGTFAMRRKLLDIIGPAAYKVHIHTFHGFAARIMEEYPDYFPRMIGSVIISEADQIKMVEKIIQSREISVLRPYGDPVYYVRPVLHEIHLLKRENISPERFQSSIHEMDEAETDEGKELSATEKEKLKKRHEKNSELAFVYATYEKELAKQKLYDFDDMLLEIIRTMEETPEFKLMLQESFQYILADEHQDANAAQNRILELLADFHDSPNLFIVGDDKQAIYRFQGASLENFLYFKKKYTEAVVINLEHNYRSHQLILDASHSLISNNPQIPGHVRTMLVSLQIGGRPIRVAELETVEAELQYVAETIRGLIEKKEKPEEIAVIYRENNHARRLAQVLKAHGVPCKIESDLDILNEPDVMKIILILRAINDLSNSEVLATALLLPELGCDPAEIVELSTLSTKNKKPLHIVIKEQKKPLHKNAPLKAYRQLVTWSNEAQVLPFLDLLDQVVQETDLVVGIVVSPRSLERLSAVEAFYDRMSRAASTKKTFLLKDCIEYLDIISSHGLASKRSHTEHISGVRLMTAHRSKGLEFNYVFIVHAADGTWGNRCSRTLFTVPIIEHARDTGRIEDERRLFYVALTRAREGIQISYARSDGTKDLIPSQFIAEIDASLIEVEKPATSRRLEQVLMQTDKAPRGGISILNATFVTSKFFGQPLSVTHLNNYLKCPWTYFFVNLLRIPQAQSKQQMYGTAIHGALRTFFEAYKHERDLNSKQLIELFKRNLERLPLSVDDRQDSFEKGKKALSGYFKTYFPLWGRRLLTEYSVRGVEFSAGKNKLQLTGNLDKVEFINESEVIVTDFKTGKPKSRNDIEGKTKDSAGDYKRQLTFYKLLLDADEKFRMRYGEIDFIEPNERGIFKKERFEITDGEVQALKEEIADMVEGIEKLTFIGSHCDEKECRFCTLGRILSESVVV